MNISFGLWVRDGTAGVGTVTFYDPSTGSFAALGHGITDVDTGELLPIASGDLLRTTILSIKKGQRGNPGQLKGTVANQTQVGNITKNTSFGIYGKMSNLSELNTNPSEELEVALRDEVKQGPAKIRCALEDGKVQEYDIEIQKVSKNNTTDNKSMVIKVTDERLIGITGGIVQGMSGSPIIQNRKFVGAVTHVLVNDPTKGYGVFADMMLKQIM